MTSQQTEPPTTVAQPAQPASIVTYGPAAAAQVSRTLADAFLHGPVPDWLVPDPEERQMVFARYFDLYAAHLVTHGLVYGTSDLAGTACWLDLSGPVPPPEIEDLNTKLLHACGERYLARFHQLHDLFDTHHPVDRPHWYLVLIGVRNSAQNKGTGTRLLRHHLDVLDEQGQDAYLESSSPHNRRLYLRHGFTDMGVQRLPDGGPEIWPMWRPAQPLEQVSS